MPFRIVLVFPQFETVRGKRNLHHQHNCFCIFDEKLRKELKKARACVCISVPVCQCVCQSLRDVISTPRKEAQFSLPHCLNQRHFCAVGVVSFELWKPKIPCNRRGQGEGGRGSQPDSRKWSRETKPTTAWLTRRLAPATRPSLNRPALPTAAIRRMRPVQVPGRLACAAIVRPPLRPQPVIVHRPANCHHCPSFR